MFLSVLGAQRNPLLPHRRVERWLETSLARPPRDIDQFARDHRAAWTRDTD